MAIVTDGKRRGRSYYSPNAGTGGRRSRSGYPMDWTSSQVRRNPRRASQGLSGAPLYGHEYEFADLFTPRQLTALTTFSDLVHEAREQATQDALAAGLADDDVPLREGGRGARAYGEAVSVYLAFAVIKQELRFYVNYYPVVMRAPDEQVIRMVTAFARHAIPMTLGLFRIVNPFSGAPPGSIR